MVAANQSNILEGTNAPVVLRRKDMIPKWIRFFAWVFAFLCPLMLLVAFIAIIWKWDYNYSKYGLSISGFNPSTLISWAGIITLVSIAITWVAAIGLLTEKNWAVRMAIADAILNILLDVLSMIIHPWVVGGHITYFSTHINIPIELILLIPYLVKMVHIRKAWEANRFALQHHSL